MFDLKGLIRAMFTREQNDGIRSLKSATVFMQELPQSDVLRAHVEIVKALRQLNSDGRISLKERLRTVPYLDEKARPLQAHLVDICHGKLIDDNVSVQHALPSMLAYWRQMGNAYRLTLKQALHAGRPVDRELQLFALRAIHFFNHEVLWACLRYMEVDPKTWRSLNWLYEFAEEHAFVTIALQPYSDAEVTDIRREYLQAAMLVLAQPERMRVEQIELAAQWLKRWSGKIELEKMIRPNQQLFAINLAGSLPPKRLRRDMVGDQWRYWFTEALVLHMRDTIAQLASGVPASQFGFPEESATPEGIAFMAQLTGCWARDTPLPSRRHERVHAKKRIRVTRGFDDVIGRLRSGATVSAANAETWEVANESTGGLGVNLSGNRSDGLRVGEIVGIEHADNGRVMIGVIRRITQKRDGQIDIGIQSLVTNPLLVELKAQAGAGSFFGVYAPENNALAQQRMLLVPHACFAADSEMDLSAQGKTYRIRLDTHAEQTLHATLSPFAVLKKLDAA
ncbi:hypothetical protein ACTSKR_04700 [Chitinibacteraceae bacterium HSL-7]